MSALPANRDRLLLPTHIAKQVESLVVAGYPDEVCGVLAGTTNTRDSLVERVFACRNIVEDRKRDRYILAPEDFLRAEIESRESGLEIVGIFHSHPDQAPVPSRTDLAAAWHGYVYLIVETSVQSANHLRAWRLVENRFTELDIATSEKESSHE